MHGATIKIKNVLI